MLPTATFGQKRKRREEEGDGTCRKRRRLLEKHHESSDRHSDQDDEERHLLGESIMDSRVEYVAGDDEFDYDGSDFYFMRESSYRHSDQDDEEPLLGESIMDSCVEYDSIDDEDEFSTDGSDFHCIQDLAESSDAYEMTEVSPSSQPTPDPTPEPTPDEEWMTDAAAGCVLGTIWIEQGGLLVRRSARLASRTRR
jgi:hypothetical protein